MGYYQSISHVQMKSINQQTILQLIYSEKTISRVELAKRTGLSQQTVTNIMNRLLEEELVIEGEHIPLKGGSGRKRIALSFNSEHHYIIGIEIAGKHVRGSIYNFNFDCLERHKLSVEKYVNAQKLLELLYEMIDDLLKKVPDVTKIKGIGISVQGLVDSQQGILLRIPGIGFMEFPLKSVLSEKYHLPIFIENDVNLFALNENIHGTLNESTNNIVLKFDYGIGGAIFADNRLISGSNFVAGEFGHIKGFTGDDAFLCLCKSKGCLTTLLSMSGLQLNTGHTLETFMQVYEAGDVKVHALYEKMINALALSISNLVTMLNPDTILLTGRVLKAFGEEAILEIKKMIVSNVPQICKNIKIEYMREMPDETMLAAGIVVKQVLEIPIEKFMI